MVNFYGISKWKEQKSLVGLRGMDLIERQRTSMMYIQAQNDLHQDILNRRRELTLRKIFNEEDYKKYMNLYYPFKKTPVNTFFKPR